AVEYVRQSSAASSEESLPTHRLGLVVIGQGVRNNEYRLFRKLRPHGTYFTRVNPAKGLSTLVDAVTKRAAAYPVPYGHWYIDGAAPATAIPSSVAHVSYASLSTARAALQGLMQRIYESSVFDPEAFRTRMAQTKPEEIGMESGGDGVLKRFQLSLFTEGSGT